MNKWQKIRLGLLIFTFVNVILVLGKAIIDPADSKSALKNYNLPSEIPLEKWQFIKSENLEKKTTNHVFYGEINVPGKKYIYVKNNEELEIYTRYLKQANGDVSELITADKSIDVQKKASNLILKQKPGIGSYALFTYQQKAHLSACINPVGITTFNKEDFRAKTKQNTITINRFLPWILGSKSLVDWRCFWSHLSIPLNNEQPDIAYQKLENVWFLWHNYWIRSYPPE
jgi:cyanosortase A-associated protein